MENKENIDQLFKNGLLEPDIPFDESNWEKMSHKLDLQAGKRRMPVWLLWGAAAAAALVIAMFWIFLKPDATIPELPSNQVVKQQQPQQQSKQEKPASGRPNQSQNQRLNARNENKRGKKPINPFGTDEKTEEPEPVYAGNQVITDTAVAKGLNLAKANQIVLNQKPAANQPKLIPFDATINTKIPKTKQPVENYATIEKTVKKKMKTGTEQGSSVTLSAMLAPDISYAKSSTPAKVSSNAGLLATYGLSRKLSVTSGAIYSNKYYNSNVDGVNAYNSSGAQYQVKASCNVLDIPLNVNYKVMDNNLFSISVNSGLSSYLMLKEKYDYIYPQAGSTPNIVTYQVKNQNKHILGVANVAITVERKLSPNITIGIQPFMKLPLTGIGAGDASLKSSGLSFSLNMGLFPSKKPGKLAGLRHY